MSVQVLAAYAFDLVAGGMLFAVAAVASLEASLPLLTFGLGLPEASAHFGRDLTAVWFALALVVMVLSISGFGHINSFRVSRSWPLDRLAVLGWW